MTRCATCRAPIDRERSWHRIDRGALVGGVTQLRDLDYCSLLCLADAWATT